MRQNAQAFCRIPFLRCPYSWLEDVFRKRTHRLNCRIGLHLNFFKSMKTDNAKYYLLSTNNCWVESRKSTPFTNENLFDATHGRLYNRKNCFIKNVDSNEKFGR